MELKVTTLEGKAAGSVELSEGIFGLEPRKDIIQRCIQWQLNKRQAGTHKAKGRAEIWRTGKKMYKQKGTGGARHGSARVPQFRGGGRAFGPVVRSHATDLPKKVRALALRHALSAKVKDGSLIVIDKAALEAAKTKALIGHFSGLGVTNALIIDGAELHTGFAIAARNIPNIDVLPIQGINVYDILRREKLVLTKAALDALEARFKRRLSIRAITTSSSLPSSPKRRRWPPNTTRWCSRSRARLPSRRSRKPSRSCLTSRSSASTRWCARARPRFSAAVSVRSRT